MSAGQPKGFAELSQSTLYRNYCLTKRSVSTQEAGWGADPRRVKRETARPHPIAGGKVNR